MKKKFINLGGFVVLVSPIVAVISCSSNSINKDEWELFDENTKIWTNGPSIKELKDEVKADENINASDDFISKIKNQGAFFEYKKEQKASQSYQIEWFNWDKYIAIEDINKKLEKLYIANFGLQINSKPIFITKDNYFSLTIEKITKLKDTINSLNFDKLNDSLKSEAKSAKDALINKLDELKTLQEKFEKIANVTQNKADSQKNDKVQKELKNDFYTSNSFSKDFPKMLQKIENIRKEEEKVFDETKYAFIQNYNTYAEGQAAWVDERKNKYNGATNDEEVIDKLVNDRIEQKAFAKYKVSIIKSFTNKQVKSGVFPFLESTDDTDNTHNKNTEDKNVYFVGSETLDPSNKRKDITKTLGTQASVLKVQHALVAIAPNSKGSTLPWTKGSSKDSDFKKTILKLFSKYGAGWGYDLLSKALTYDANGLTKESKVFLEHVSDNSSGTKKIEGDLGLYEFSDLLASMDPGFSFGIANAFKGGQDNLANGLLNGIIGTKTADDVLTSLTTKFDAYLKNDLNLDKATATQQQIEEAINNTNENEFNNKIGSFFRDVFNDKQMYYKFKNDDRILVVSGFGFHIIKYKMLDNTSLNKAINDDITKAKKEKDKTKVNFNEYNKIFKNIYDNRGIVEELINDNEFMIELKKYATDEILDDWVNQKYLKNKTDDLKTTISNHLSDLKNSENLDKLISGLGNKIESYFIKRIDDNLLKIPTTITPQMVYDRIRKLGGVK